MSKKPEGCDRTLAGDVFAACYNEGHFVLRSGRVANYYFDKYKFESDPALLKRIAKALASLIPPETEILAGLEMGGIPIVTMLSQISDIPAAFVRKKAKEHGTEKLAEGIDIVDRRVTIVEDVVSSAGQIVLSSIDLKNLGAAVTDALCVVDRQEGGQAALREHGITLIPLFVADDLKASVTETSNVT
jgi:orotate phosphoribosyltransferase